MISIAGILNSLLYPYFMAFGFADIWDVQMICLFLCEFLAFIDIFACCFVMYKDENTEAFETNYKKIAYNYYKTKFLFDIITFLPFGFLMLMNKFFKIFWALKALKIFKLFEFIDPI